MTLNERYRAIYMRLYGFKDFCDEQHNNVMRELEKELSAAPEAAYRNGYSTAIETAAQHVEYQHAVWDLTEVPPRVLLDMLAKNIRAFDGPPRPGEDH